MEKTEFKVGDFIHHELLRIKQEWKIVEITPNRYVIQLVNGHHMFLELRKERIGENAVIPSLDKFVLGKHPNSSDWVIPKVRNLTLHSIETTQRLKCFVTETTELTQNQRGYITEKYGTIIFEEKGSWSAMPEIEFLDFS